MGKIREIVVFGSTDDQSSRHNSAPMGMQRKRRIFILENWTGYPMVSVSLIRIHKSGFKIGKPRESQFDIFGSHNFFYRQYLENR